MSALKICLVTVFLVLVTGLTLKQGFCGTHELSDNLARDVLSEIVPFTFDPSEMNASDFRLEWVGVPLEDARMKIGRESFEWVRVNEVFLLPRGRMILEVKNIEKGQIGNNGFVQPILVKGGNGSAQIPIALISGEKNLIHITVWKSGRPIKGLISVRYHPRKGMEAHLISDPSCSPYNVNLDGKIPRDSWAYIGCRRSIVQGDQHATNSLEVFVFWDNVGQKVLIDNVSTASNNSSAWAFRLRAKPGKVKFEVQGQVAQLNYRIPDKFNPIFFGLGAGPYHYTIRGAGENTVTIAPIAMIYGSYFLDTTTRIVFFNATSIHKKYFSDLGLYLVTEQFRVFDDRFVLNLLLGAHALAFNAKSNSYVRLSAPQGAELMVTDFLKKNHKISLGGFLLPNIKGTSYYNVWLRWGSAIFGEINYIAWREPVGEESIFSRSFGLTFGFPLMMFL